MKRIFTTVCALALVVAGAVPALASEPVQAEDSGQSTHYYPVSVDEYTAGDLDEPRISKTYRLSRTDNPSLIPTEDFERNGRLYYLLDMTREDEIGVDVKAHTETITMASDTDDMEEILKQLEAEQEVTTEDGYAWFEDLTESGRYYLRELENEGYIPDTQLRTVYVKAGETTEVTWENTPITAQIQIVKKSADYNPTTGLPAGTLLEGAVFEIYDKAGNLVDTIRSDSRGLAVSKPLPLSRYTIREIKAPDHYGINETELTAYLEHEGQIVRFEVTNKSLTTGVSITKTGPQEIMAGQPVRYAFSNIANTSNVRLDSFYFRDTLPAEVRLDTVVTGTYNFPGTYKITYRVNGGEYRTLADNLSTSQNYTLKKGWSDPSPSAAAVRSSGTAR